MSFPARASTQGPCELDAVFGFKKRRGLAIWTGWDIVACDDYSRAALSEVPESNCKVVCQANAAV